MKQPATCVDSTTSISGSVETGVSVYTDVSSKSSKLQWVVYAYLSLVYVHNRNKIKIQYEGKSDTFTKKSILAKCMSLNSGKQRRNFTTHRQYVKKYINVYLILIARYFSDR